MELMLLLISSLLLTARVAAASSAVLDRDGNELRRGQLYYAFSSLRPDSGLALASPNGTSCPLNVGMAPVGFKGRPLTFFPENPKDDTVQEGSTLYVMFPQPTRCPQSTTWTIEEKADLLAVTMGGTKSSSIGPHRSRFAIRKVGDGYVLDSCPCSVGVPWASCRMGCWGSLDLVRLGNTGRPILAVGGEDKYLVTFSKVEDGMRVSQ